LVGLPVEFTVGRALTERLGLFTGVITLVPGANTLRSEFSPSGPASDRPSHRTMRSMRTCGPSCSGAPAFPLGSHASQRNRQALALKPVSNFALADCCANAFEVRP
jgi:hypothetical protein